DFLTNLDNLHDHLGSIYPGMRAPSFRVTPAAEDGSMHLHYYSERKGLSAIVRGLVTIVSTEFFKTEVDVKTLGEEPDGHVVLEVTLKKGVESGKEELDKLGRLMTKKDDLGRYSTKPKDLKFNVNTICTAFPFHVMFTRD